MNFLNPAFLFGLIAAALPIILHILNLRKLKTIEFSSLQFLKEMQKNKIRRIKLKQILLLIIRTLLVICIVLAFSRPVVDSSIAGLESYSKSSNVLLIDNSFSMDFSDERGNRFNQCKRAANDILASLREGDEVVLLDMASPEGGKIYDWTRSHDIVKEELTKLNISYRPADLDKYLKIAERLLSESQNFSKNIFIITDGQPNIFAEAQPVPLLLNHTNIYFVPIGGSGSGKNLSLDSLAIISQIFQVNKAVEIEAVVKNNSSAAADAAMLELSWGGAGVAARTFDIGPGQVRSIAVGAVPAAAGAYSASIELEGDAFVEDNKRWFGFMIPDKPAVALFSDEPVATDFVSTALSVGNFARVSRYASSQLASVNLSQFSLAVVSVGKYSSSDFALLKQYITSGGSVLLFATDKTDGGVLQSALVELGFGVTTLTEYSHGQPGRFTATDKVHPLFEGVFKIDNDSRGVVESPNIYKARLAKAGVAVIEAAGGAFLSESIVGQGRVLYCAVSPTLDWSNFPVTGIFPAIITRGVALLGSHPELSHNFELGSGATLMIQKKYATGSNFRIIDPSGGEFLRQAALLPSGAVLDFSDMNLPGVYTIYNSNGVVVALLALNLQRSESDFTKYSVAEVEARLARWVDTLAVGSNIGVLESADGIVDSIDRIRMGTELWRPLILLALLLALAELLISRSSKLAAAQVEQG